jgi:hypothetical protein
MFRHELSPNFEIPFTRGGQPSFPAWFSNESHNQQHMSGESFSALLHLVHFLHDGRLPGFLNPENALDIAWK